MKEKMRKMPISVILMFMVALGLLVFSTVGGARAVLSIESQEYDARMSMYNIGVQLNENGNELNKRYYDGGQFYPETPEYVKMNILGENESLVVGKTYPEVLTVKNIGSIDEYVRVEIYKYWTTDGTASKDEMKQQARNPGLIKLGINTDDWYLDKNATTDERVVLYYPKVLHAEIPEEEGTFAEESPAFLNTITIDDAIKKYATQTETESTVQVDGKDVTVKTVTTTYTYDSLNFAVEVKVEAVQTHNAEAAIKSAWGVSVSRNADGSLSFN